MMRVFSSEIGFDGTTALDSTSGTRSHASVSFHTDLLDASPLPSATLPVLYARVDNHGAGAYSGSRYPPR
jgi:hypothetical protein